jgi:hypothetical protein
VRVMVPGLVGRAVALPADAIGFASLLPCVVGWRWKSVRT